MKYLSICFLTLVSSSAFAFECSYDERAVDGGAAKIQISKQADEYYRIALSQLGGWATQMDTVVYSNVGCEVSKKNPLLMSCMAPIKIGGEERRIQIDTHLTFGWLGDTLAVLVDTSGLSAEAADAIKLKNVYAPVESCKF